MKLGIVYIQGTRCPSTQQDAENRDYIIPEHCIEFLKTSCKAWNVYYFIHYQSIVENEGPDIINELNMSWKSEARLKTLALV
jgi:hypothetical protein